MSYPRTGIAAAALAIVVAAGSTPAGGSAPPASDETSTPAEGPSDASEPIVIGYSMAIGTDSTNSDTALGMECALSQNSGELISTDANLDVNKQLSDIESLIVQQVDALVVATLDPTTIEAAFVAAADAGIPVIDLFNPASTQPGQVLPDTESWGSPIAEAVHERFPDGATVLLNRAPYPQAEAQADSFVAAAEQYPEIEIVDTVTVDNPQVEGSASAFGDVLTRHPDVNVIVALDDTIAIGASVAASDRGMDVSEMEIIGSNGKPDGLQAIREGVISATYALDVFAMGEGLVAMAEQLIAGETVEPLLVPFERTDATNVDSITPASERCQ